MKIPKEIYRYVEYEMYHYTSYKNLLLADKYSVSVSYSDNKILQKIISLNKTRQIQNMAGTVNAVDNALRMLDEGHRQLFNHVYVKGRRDIYRLCMDMGISDRTYWNYKKDLVNLVAAEMGKLPLVV